MARTLGTQRRTERRQDNTWKGVLSFPSVGAAGGALLGQGWLLEDPPPPLMTVARRGLVCPSNLANLALK